MRCSSGDHLSELLVHKIKESWLDMHIHQS
jgi:hypothetical protein